MEGETILGIVAVIGTLAGTGIGAFVTWKIQEQRLQHEDRTRFHERRLATYAAYIEAATLTGAGYGMPIETTPALFRAAQAARVEFETIRLVASKPVVDAVNKVHLSVVAALKGASTGELVRSELNLATTALIDEIRSELGVEEFDNAKDKK